jgi:Glyoxalase-like domain
MAIATFRDIVIDCADPVTLAPFWSEVLGFPVAAQEDDGEQVRLDSPDNAFRIWLVRVPEPKTAKNRLHIDVNLAPGMGLEQLEQLGAKVLHPFGWHPDIPWAVLADPQGNEFCAFPAP